MIDPYGTPPVIGISSVLPATLRVPVLSARYDRNTRSRYLGTFQETSDLTMSSHLTLLKAFFISRLYNRSAGC